MTTVTVGVKTSTVPGCVPVGPATVVVARSFPLKGTVTVMKPAFIGAGVMTTTVPGCVPEG